MKKNTILLIIVLVLATIAGWFYFNNRTGTISEALRDFGVSDTGSVVKLFLANKSGQQTLLERQPNGDWLMNGKYLARPDAVTTLLETMHNVEVRSPVAKAAYNNVIKKIASNGIKVEIYTAAGKLKTYYVGGPTQDQMGTFMYLENSTVPFITHIPGFDGYLTPRYIANEDEWRIKSVFRLGEGMLKNLKVTDYQQTERSFSVSKLENGSYQLLDGSGKVVEGLSQDKMINYLQTYRMLNFEMNEKSLTASQLDSVRASAPFRSIEMTDVNDVQTKVNFWRRPITTSTVHKQTEDGTPFPFDVDRMIAKINNDTTLVVVQYYSFEKLFRKPADFIMQPAQK